MCRGRFRCSRTDWSGARKACGGEGEERGRGARPGGCMEGGSRSRAARVGRGGRWRSFLSRSSCRRGVGPIAKEASDACFSCILSLPFDLSSFVRACLLRCSGREDWCGAPSASFSSFVRVLFFRFVRVFPLCFPLFSLHFYFSLFVFSLSRASPPASFAFCSFVFCDASSCTRCPHFLSSIDLSPRAFPPGSFFPFPLEQGLPSLLATRFVSSSLWLHPSLCLWSVL